MNTNFKAFIGVEKGTEGTFVSSDSEIQDLNSPGTPIPKYTNVTLGTMYHMNGDPNFIACSTKSALYTHITWYVVQPDKTTIDFITLSFSPLEFLTVTRNSGYKMGCVTQSAPRSTAAYIGAYFSTKVPSQNEVSEVMHPYVVADYTPKVIKVTHTVKTNHIYYCTTDAPTTIEDGETLNVVITPNSGYEFSKDGKWYEGDGSEPNSIAHKFTPTGTTYTLSIPNVKTDIDVWLDATKQNVVPETVTYVEHLTNCTSSLTGQSTITKGSNIEITFKANDGCEFSTGGTWSQQTDPSEPGQSKDFFPTDKHQFTLKLDYVYAPVTVTLSATKPVVTTATAFSNLYLTNDGELGNLATERFYEEKTSDSGVNVDIIDYGKQILNLLRLPFPIPKEIQDETKRPIQLGSKKTSVDSTPILADTYKLNIGAISVPEIYKNVIDYRYTDCILHLPFVDEMKLDVEYTIGYTITIFYVVNLYTGKATIVLSTSKTGTVFHTETISIGQKLPFIQLADNTDYSSYGSPVYMGIKQAYIDVISQPPLENATMRVNEHGKLKDYTGYTEASTLNLITSATVSEQEDIKQLLNQGVYINDTNTIS